MKIIIEDSVVNNYKFNFKKHIVKLIRYIPITHIAKLELIKVVSAPIKSRYGDSRGMYYAKYDSYGPAILISIEGIFGRMPRLFFYLPLIPKISLSYTLYHEIGHHYQKKFTHGIKRSAAENHVKRYAINMQKKAFRGYFLFLWIVFWPLLLIRYFLKHKQEDKGNLKRRVGGDVVS